MSTSPRPDPREHTPEHVPAAAVGVRAEFRATMAAAADLDFLAHFSGGALVFALDRFDDPPGALAGGSRRDAVERLGRQVTTAARGLDRRLQRVRTGRLIRTVVSTEANALFCDTVRPGDDVVGVMSVTAGRAAVDAGDRAVAELATRLRGFEGLPAPNYGSFDTVPDPEHNPTRPLAHPGDADIPALLRAEVDPAGLHLVSYWSGGQETTVDCLGADAVAALSPHAPAAQRRAFYTELGAELGPLANELNRATSGALRGRLTRLVLDVENGAVYYRRLPARRYLVGVTLAQRLVATADDRLAALATDLTGLGG
ncbi:hypothetical protein [Actinokineospora pegani]|uniref:hypothetical protein n=1 Tax=Actinokineospora pegani TaxID=2654637 RepID=UPI0012EA62E4|nr:hypothetical protein [Actinokineospora pegani]